MCRRSTRLPADAALKSVTSVGYKRMNSRPTVAIPEGMLKAVIDEDSVFKLIYERPGKHDAWFIEHGLTSVPRAFRPTSLAEIQFYLRQASIEASLDNIRDALAAINDPFIASRHQPPVPYLMPPAAPCGSAGPCSSPPVCPACMMPSCACSFNVSRTCSGQSGCPCGQPSSCPMQQGSPRRA